MPVIADVYADVVQQGCIFQPLALTIAKSMDATCLIENAERQPRHLLRMLRPVSAPFTQLDDAAAAHVGITLDLADARAVSVNVIEHETFAQRKIAQRQVFGTEAAKNRVEEYRARDGQVGSARIQPRHVQALFNIRFDEPLPQPMHRLRADALISDVLRRRAFLLGDGKGAETENGAGRSDHPIEARLRDLCEIRTHLFVEMFDETPFVVRRERVGFDEPLGQAKGAGLEALAEGQVGGGAERDFDTAAADVNHDGSTAANIHPVAGGKVNQPRLPGP